MSRKGVTGMEVMKNSADSQHFIMLSSFEMCTTCGIRSVKYRNHEPHCFGTSGTCICLWIVVSVGSAVKMVCAMLLRRNSVQSKYGKN